MATGILTTCSKCGRPCRQKKELYGFRPAVCGACRRSRDLTKLITCECCKKKKPLAEFLAPGGGRNKNCRSCIESGAAKKAAYKKQSQTQKNKRKSKEMPSVAGRVESQFLNDPFSGEERFAG